MRTVDACSHKGKNKLPIKQTNHGVNQIPQTSKATSQHNKETQHEVTSQGTCTYHTGKVMNSNTSKHRYAGILIITEIKKNDTYALSIQRKILTYKSSGKLTGKLNE